MREGLRFVISGPSRMLGSAGVVLMCGRYTNHAELEDMQRRWGVRQLELFSGWRPTYNVAPSRGPGFEQPLVLRDGGDLRLRLGRWWFIPPDWRGPLARLPTAFNARVEDLERKRLWRRASHEGRCLLPATGWREFRGEPGGKQPYHFHFGGALFAFAGVCSRWRSPEGELVDSFAILTTAPHPLAASIHDRMPLVLDAELEAAWLDPAQDPASLAARAVARSRTLPLEVYASDPVGNRTGVEGPEVIAPAPARSFEQQDLFTPHESG